MNTAPVRWARPPAFRNHRVSPVTAAAPSHAPAVFEARLRAAGWTSRPPSDEPQRGFLPAYTHDSERGFCWPDTDANLTVNIRPAPGGGSYIVMNHFEARDGRYCHQPPPPQRRMSRVLESTMPSLRPPDGAVITPVGGGGGGTDYEVRAAVTSQHAPAQLIRHFQPQLEEQGWSINEVLTGDAMAVVAAKRTLDSGAEALLWVSSSRQDPEQVALDMRITVRPGSR